MIDSLGVLILTMASAQGVVVTGTNIQISSGGGFLSDYQLTVDQVADRGDYTSLGVNFDGSTISAIGLNIDEGSDWYLVSGNDVFSGPNILANAFPYLARVNAGGGQDLTSLSVGPGNFHLGVATDVAGPGQPRTAFGWVELAISGTTLSIVDSAVSYGPPENGIIVGTSTAVPEPSSVLLLGLSLVTFLHRRRA